jgi:transposase InsO family protein
VNSNIAATARAFDITRPVVYDILAKAQSGDLRDRPRTPRRQPGKTPAEVEGRVIAAKNRTHLGPKRLSLYLAKYEDLQLSWATIRNILRRNRHRLTTPMSKRRSGSARPFVDWYSAKPFEVVQVDLKYIRDQDALSKEQIAHLDQHQIPNFQWSALDVYSRFKLIAYSRERTWTNGLCFYLWVLAWLRSHGVTAQIAFTVDHGEEFGGKSWFKVQELRKLIAGFGCRLIQNHKGHPEENAHLERSHRTDDEEFYIPRVLRIKSEQDLLDEATGYVYYYNNVREHSALDYRTPFQALKTALPQLDERARCPPPFILDEVSTDIGPWSGYNLLAHYPRVYHATCPGASSTPTVMAVTLLAPAVLSSSPSRPANHSASRSAVELSMGRATTSSVGKTQPRSPKRTFQFLVPLLTSRTGLSS